MAARQPPRTSTHCALPTVSVRTELGRAHSAPEKVRLEWTSPRRSRRVQAVVTLPETHINALVVPVIDSKPQEGGDVVNMVQLCNIVRYIKVCNHTDLLLRKFVIQVEWASPRRQDSRGLILPGDPRTREQQVLRLVVWGLII